MGDVGTFPFGWVRGIKDDNWQIIWDPKTGIITAEGAVSKKVLEVGKSSKWMEAKVCADKVMSEPLLFFDD